MRAGRTSFGAAIALSAASIAVVAIVAELLLWSFSPLPHPYASVANPDERVYDEVRRAPRNRYVPSYHTPKTLELRPDPAVLGGLSATATFTINRFGFRSSRMQSIIKSSDTARIFAVGGSTTECLYLDDADAWPEVLQRQLAGSSPGVSIDVINAGHSGDTTRDHIALLTQRIVALKPDIVLFLVGINDLALQLEPDYSPLRGDSRSIIPEARPQVSVWLKTGAADFSQLARAAILAWRRGTKHDAGRNPVQDLHGKWIARARDELRKTPIREVLPDSLPAAEFAENLRTLVAAARAGGAEAVLLTQPALWGAPSGEWESLLWRSYRGRIPHQTLWLLMERFNDATRQVAAELDVPLVDLAVAIAKTPAMFYDDDHVTVAGARAIGREIARVFAANPRLQGKLRRDVTTAR